MTTMLWATGLAAVFLAGVALTAAGVYAVDHRRFVRGGALLGVGLVLAIWSGIRLNHRFFSSDMEKRIRATERQLSQARAQCKEVEARRQDFTRQEKDLVELARPRLQGTVPFATQLEGDVELRALVEKITLTRRWLAECDKASLELKATEKALENSLFYLNSLDALSVMGEEHLLGGEATAALEALRGQAATPAGGSVPIPMTDDEIREIGRRLAQ